jgi:hypothetical protein
MSIKKLAYNGSSKILKNVVNTINALVDQGGGGGGSTVSWTQIQQTGTKIAEIDIDGTSTNVYAPNGGGSGNELYLNNGQIGSDSGVYVTCNLDKTLVNGFYLVRVYDSSNSAVGFYHMKWEGTSQVLSISDTVSQGRLEITSTTAGLTYYSGAWRNIYCDILSLYTS